MQRSPTLNSEYVRRVSFPIERATLLHASILLGVDASGISPNESRTSVERSEFEHFLRRLRRRHMLAGLLACVPGLPNAGGGILAPGRVSSSDAAVLLAFHATGVRVEDTATALAIGDQRAGELLYRARREIAVGGRLDRGSDPCQEYRSDLGWGADQLDGQHVTGELRDHVSRCQRCASALHTQQQVNSQLLAAARSVAHNPPASAATNGSQHFKPLTAGPIMLIVVALAVALLGFPTRPDSSDNRVTLLPQSGVTAHPGWLILSSETEVMAIDLENGERRRILDGPAHDWWNPWILSPDSSLAVKWEERSRTDGMFGSLRAYDMQGELRYLHRWDQRRSRTFSGWLNSRTILFHEHGAARRAGDRSELSPSALPSLVAVDLPTGAERELYRGRFDKAVPAPDGRHIAIVHAAETRWPGKTIGIYPVIDALRLGDPVNVAEHRVLGWPGRIIWSGNSESVFFSAIERNLVPDRTDEITEPVPGQFDFDRVIAVRLSIDGSIKDLPIEDRAVVTVQSANHKGTALSVLVSERPNDPDTWRYGHYPNLEGELILHDASPPGGNWWNSEVAWSPDGERRLVQQLVPMQIDGGNPDSGITSLALMEIDETGDLRPAVVFHDALAMGVRFGRGIALLRWVPDERMTVRPRTVTDSPQPGTPSQVAQADGPQQLFGDSEVAPSGRHILLHEESPEDGTILRLIHMQAWSGARPRIRDWAEFSWLPREPAAIGTTGIIGQSEHASRLVVLSTDQLSPLHGKFLDPAEIAGNPGYRYRRPTVSPNGLYMAFFVQDRRAGSLSLWLGEWGEPARQLETWDYPANARFDVRVTGKWITNDAFVFGAVSEWHDRYPHRVALKRLEVGPNGDWMINTLREFQAGGRDRGIELADFAISQDRSLVAYRVRRYSGADQERNAVDSIEVSSAYDLTQSVELSRGGTGEGMAWAPQNDWLIAGTGGRLALLEQSGREIIFLTDGEAAFPVLVGNNEVWYQEMESPWRIMRFAVNQS